MSEFTVFYAWQSDRPAKTNRYLIRDAIGEAVKRLKKDAEVFDAARLDHDTKNVSGLPDIAATILQKIDRCGVFVGDVSFVAETTSKEPKFIPNPNVMCEVGYALKATNSARVVLVMNNFYGTAEKLPFDLRSRRHPIQYTLAPDADNSEIKAARQDLAEKLFAAIKMVVLAHPESTKPVGHDLHITVNPTRNGRRQLAQIVLFNAGNGPLFISEWFALWGPSSVRSSVQCYRGELPHRLAEQDRMEILIDVGDRPIEELTGIGVIDGARTTWRADDNNIKRFVHTAKLHAPPPIPEAEATAVPLDTAIEIETRCVDRSSGKRLEVILRNQGDEPIQALGADLKWEYAEPRWMPHEPGQMRIAESGGSASMVAATGDVTIPPGEEKCFFLDSSALPVSAVLADDVHDDGISIVIYASEEGAWKVFGDEVPDEVRKFARAML
jgi:hypothetical protein